MRTDHRIEIAAPADRVWGIFTDVERWPEWTDSVTGLVALDAPGIEVGRRFEIKQPGLPPLVWEVTEVDPGTSWTWRQKSPGGTTTASHQLESRSDGGTLVRQQIDQRGPVGTLIGVLMRRKTRRFLDLEARGLKAQSEGRLRHDAPPA